MHKPPKPLIANPEAILKSVWGFDGFRGIQENIINTVLEGKNAFVSLPTGGGKSLCYQIPVLCQDGVGIVVSPLIALMKDQVNNLNKVGVKAAEISGGLSPAEISEVIDNCIYGNYKFLYLSPERLASEGIQEQLKRIPVNFIILDEAHCISQWGHDFRPAYLKVTTLIQLFPNAPVIALTATATADVKKDILTVLSLHEISEFSESFERKNIAYSVFKVVDKLHYVEKICTKNKASSIVYVRNRKACINWSNQLNGLGYTSTFYHGGMLTKDKTKNMMAWLNNQAQIMVATNAFGMGIDKPDVQTVIHIDLPENIENYYQESGRAGRNGLPAHAVLLCTDADIQKTEYQVISNLPDKKFLLNFYKKLCSYSEIAYGEGENELFDINFELFCKKNNFPIYQAFASLQFLDRQNVLELEPDFSNKTMVQLLLSSQEMIQLIENSNPKTANVLLTIMRNYSGIYELPLQINTSLMAQKCQISTTELHHELLALHQNKTIKYEAESVNIRFRMTGIRADEYTINPISKHLEKQNKLKTDKLKAVIAYVNDTTTCRNRILLQYFGEAKKENCGICSNCLKQSESKATVTEKIKNLLAKNELNSKDIALVLSENEEVIISGLQQLLQENSIGITIKNNYYLL